MTDRQPSADATVPLHYRIDGDAGAAAERLVLIHPVGLNHTCFDGLVAALGAGVAVLRMDLRGHGRSPVAPSPDGVRGYARDVHALLATTRFAPAVVVGFSFGGMVAQWLAVTFPADVAALVAGACACTFTNEQRRMLGERGEAARRDGMSAIVEPTLERWFSEGFRRGPGIAPFRQRLLDDSPEGWAQAWQAIAALDVADHLGAIRVPALCLAADADAAAPPPIVAAMAARIAGSRLVVVLNASHMLFIEEPDAVAAEIRRFLVSTLLDGR